MSRLQNILTAFVLALLTTNAALAEQSGWQLAAERDGVRAYTRAIDDSDYREFKGEMLVSASINQLLGLLDDTQACPQWMHNCVAPQLLSAVSARERYTYMRNDLPWPYSDRELLVHSVIHNDGDSVTIELKGVDEEALPAKAQATLPSGKKFERAKSLRGFWRFTPQGDSYHIHYQLHIDLGGSPAPALANGQIADTPLNTLLNMRELLLAGAYREFKIPDGF